MGNQHERQKCIGCRALRGTVNATTTYTPGPIVYSGTHDQSIGVRMFRDGEPGAAQALSARETLGPKWEKIVKDGVLTCGA